MLTLHVLIGSTDTIGLVCTLMAHVDALLEGYKTSICPVIAKYCLAWKRVLINFVVPFETFSNFGEPKLSYCCNASTSYIVLKFFISAAREDARAHITFILAGFKICLRIWFETR